MAHKQLRLPGEKVKVSNDLVRRARVAGGSIFAGRIVAAFASVVNDGDADFKKYSIPVRSIMDRSDGRTFERVSAAADLLLKSIVEIPTDRPETFRKYTLLSSMEYKDGILTGGFHADLKPFFLNLKERFTLFPLAEFLALPTTYSQKIYEFLRSWDDQNSIEVPLTELHEMLSTPPSLQRNFKDFRLRVLVPASRAISEKTSLKFTWEGIKHGRKVVAVLFRFAEAKAAKQVKLPETAPPPFAPAPTRPKADAAEHAKRVKAQAAAILAGSIGRGEK